MKRIGLMSCLAVLGLVVGALTLATAAGPGASAAATPKLNMTAIQASMKAHNGVLTASAARQFGIRPDTVYVNTSQVRAQHVAVDAAAARARRGTITPDSASGCNQEVCIEVIGSGLIVDQWNTFAYPPGDDCSFAAYWEDGEIAFTGEEVCGTLLETFASDFDGEFDNGEQVCNSWVNIGGFPCETIHG